MRISLNRQVKLLGVIGREYAADQEYDGEEYDGGKYYDEDYEEVFVEKIKELVPDYLAIKKVREKSLHYAV